MEDGLYNIYKPAGITSHDAVEQIREYTDKKAGHTGTLDPHAEGVLLICVGKGTKLVRFITSEKKRYRCEITLGLTTDTQDIWGDTLEINSNFIFSRSDIETVFKDIEKITEQIPPMFSAVKHKGRKLYELAREGKKVKRKPRQVQIYELKIIECPTRLNHAENTLVFEAEVSKGTYIRTLCHDIGQRLGSGGCMSSLTRLAVGSFNISESVPLSSFSDRTEKSKNIRKLLSIKEVMSRLNIPGFEVKQKALKWALNGAVLDINWLKSKPENIIDGAHLYLMDPELKIISINKVIKSESFKIKPVVVFPRG